jgi:AraC family transcriptional regulator, regulatory protein of adaptative response / methylated-DNA-[protein]-cysteine methyltransferase
LNLGIGIARKNRSVRASDLGDDECMKNNVQFAAVDRDVPTIDVERAWQQVCKRDGSTRFFYAVATTGVFCRPDCKSRRPLRENVRFFETTAAAQAAGFRPCLRCKPIAPRRNFMDQVRAHIEANLDRAVSLAELGRVAGMSPFTVQRQFKQDMGVSPLQYQRSLRAGRLRGELKRDGRVTDAIYEAGFGSSSRGYEGAALGMAPSRFALGGEGETIRWASARTPFGWVIVGSTERGLCWLSLAGTAAEAEASLRAEFPAATIRRDATLSRLVDAALESVREGSDLSGNRAGNGAGNRGVPGNLDLRGTVFQLRVWQALRTIPRGETRSYSEVAREIGKPKAIRAVARACAVNRVAILVPCHRVVGANGSLTGYRWGAERKHLLLAAEKIRASLNA